jgi:hypothetical protein
LKSNLVFNSKHYVGYSFTHRKWVFLPETEYRTRLYKGSFQLTLNRKCQI